MLIVDNLKSKEKVDLSRTILECKSYFSTVSIAKFIHLSRTIYFVRDKVKYGGNYEIY